MSLHPARYSELERQPILENFVGPGALLILVCLKHRAKPGKPRPGVSEMARRRKGKAQSDTLDGKKRKPDPNGYYDWLIGKGYAPANAMRMVEAKFGGEEKREPSLGWAWKG